MNQNQCPQCGAPVDMGAGECKFCGEKIVVQYQNQAAQSYQQAPQHQAPPVMNNAYIQPPQQNYQYGQPQVNQGNLYGNAGGNPAISPSWPIKNKVVAGILAIFLGGFGIHKFYMGKVGMGIIYLLFCWTGFPVIIGLVEGIIYLCSNDENFQLKNRVRLQ